jgi:hypothetical protein
MTLEASHLEIRIDLNMHAGDQQIFGEEWISF